MDVLTWFWIVTGTLIVVMLTVDFVGHVRTPHAPTLREAAIWSAVYVAIALVFGVAILFAWDQTHGVAYFSGYLLEKSLSVDNLFVFLLIMTAFRVPREYQQKVLLIGIVIALAMRTVFIFLGSAVVENFSWIFWIFGFFMLYTAWTQARHKSDSSEEYSESGFLRLVRRIFPTTEDYVGDKLVLRRSGRTMITPMLIVMLAIGSADLLFAVDSIPAIFGVTTELSGGEQIFIIFAANAFSLLGLRQLYFLIDGLLDRLVYLHFGLAAILTFIGAKMIIHAARTNELSWINGGEEITVVPAVPTWLSLIVIVVVLTITAIASLTVGARRHPAGIGHGEGQQEPPHGVATQQLTTDGGSPYVPSDAGRGSSDRD